MRRAAALSLLFAFSTTTMSWAPAAPVFAQETSDARESFRRGEAAYSAGNYEVAISAWNEAYALDPRPRIQFNLSQAYERLGQLANAEAALVKFIESGDPDDPTYSDANARLVALRQRIAATGVTVHGGVEGGSIWVDDQNWGSTPRPDKISVTPGNHTLIVRWPGRPEFRAEFYVPAGQVVDVELPNGEAAAPAPANTQNVDDDRAPRSWKRPLYFGIGGGLAASGVGLIIYGAVRGNAVPSSCEGENATFYCNPSDVDAADRQSVAGYAVGGTLLAGAAVMFIVGALTGKSSNETRAEGSRCDLGFASASCRVRF